MGDSEFINYGVQSGPRLGQSITEGHPSGKRGFLWEGGLTSNHAERMVPVITPLIEVVYSSPHHFHLSTATKATLKFSLSCELPLSLAGTFLSLPRGCVLLPCDRPPRQLGGHGLFLLLFSLASAESHQSLLLSGLFLLTPDKMVHKPPFESVLKFLY